MLVPLNSQPPSRISISVSVSSSSWECFFGLAITRSFARLGGRMNRRGRLNSNHHLKTLFPTWWTNLFKICRTIPCQIYPIRLLVISGNIDYWLCNFVYVRKCWMIKYEIRFNSNNNSLTVAIIAAITSSIAMDILIVSKVREVVQVCYAISKLKPHL